MTIVRMISLLLLQFLPMTCVLRVDDAEGAVKLLEVKES